MAIDTQFAIDHRSNLSYNEFAAEYLYANRPVVVTDAIRNWPLCRGGPPNFLRVSSGG